MQSYREVAVAGTHDSFNGSSKGATFPAHAALTVPKEEPKTLADEQPLNLQQGRAAFDQNPGSQNDQSQEWQAMARAWLCAFPEARPLSTAEIEAWIDSNGHSLPAELRGMPRSELIDRLLSIQNILRPPPQEKEASQAEPPHARFQRTDQWIPVYAWLESLDQDEVVKSKDISDWLNENPKVKEQLCSRHSRYHLMHYIKKCHVKILKRREKKKGLQHPDKGTSSSVQKPVAVKQPAPPPSNPLNNLPKDSDLYVAKRNEALQKYEILVELEKHLTTLFPIRKVVEK